MKKPLLCAAVIILAAGCADIPDRTSSPAEQITAEASNTLEADSDKPEKVDELPPEEYEIESKDTLIKLNAEGGVFEGNARTDGTYDGNGYIILEEGKTLVHIAEAPASQHYRLVIAAYSYAGAAISLSTGSEGTVGVYYIPKTDEPEFTQFSIDSVYMPEGPMLLTFEVLSGTASIDYVLVEDSTAAPSSCYRTPVSVVGKNTGIHTIGTMKYFTDVYGSRIITAQNVTPGTNAEIDAVYAETQRYPAMRCGDMMYVSSIADESTCDIPEKETELALEWARNGGISSLGWHWYSPQKYSSDCYANGTTFSLSEAVTDRDIANASPEELQALLDSSIITEECMLLIKDIDLAAEQLKKFRDEYLTVVWQPIPNGDSELYWWSKNAENYKWLWRLMFKRMNEYHRLNNLVWVWNGSNPEFYPGDDYCDIIGQGIFMNSSASNAGRFAALSYISGTCIKPAAITSCDTIPDPDYCRRDNALWLWAAPASGTYTIYPDGSYSEKYTSWQRLNDIYKSKLCVTLDELPDFSTYALDASVDTHEENTTADNNT
ncbi:MAG: glycosyl hydrolase [Oscillospiraceae bacterium]